MEQDGGAFDMPEKLMPKANTLMSALDEPRDVRDNAWFVEAVL